MKKFLALFLVLVMAFSCVLVSCNKDNGNNEDETGDDDDIIGIGTQPTGTTTSGDGDTTPTDDKTTYTDFSWTDDTAGTMVYINVDRLNVRSDTSTTDATYRATALYGESYKRLKYNEHWTLIDYKGHEYYVKTEYVTTDDGSFVFTNDAEQTTVYVIASKLRLRTNTYEDKKDGNVVLYANKGAELTRVATSKNGAWIRVNCTYIPEGETEPKTLENIYCGAEWVSTTKDAEPTVTPPAQG